MQKRDFLRKNVNAVNLDELMYELRCTTTTLTAVHTAMEKQDFEPRFYSDALFGCVLSFFNLIDKFDAEIYEEDKNDE